MAFYRFAFFPAVFSDGRGFLEPLRVPRTTGRKNITGVRDSGHDVDFDRDRAVFRMSFPTIRQNTRLDDLLEYERRLASL